MKVAFSDFKAKGPLSKYIVRIQSSFDFHEKNLQEKIRCNFASNSIPLFHSPRGKQFSLCPDLINLYNGRGKKKEKKKKKKEKEKRRKEKKNRPRDQPESGIRSRAKNEYKLVLFRAQLIIPAAYVRI